jgi:hypothetical protein
MIETLILAESCSETQGINNAITNDKEIFPFIMLSSLL